MLESMYFDACRLCLKTSDQSMFNILVENQQIPILLERFINLKIIKGEHIESYLPQQICVLCNKKLQQIVDFKELCLNSDIFLKKEIVSYKKDEESSKSITKQDFSSISKKHTKHKVKQLLHKLRTSSIDNKILRNKTTLSVKEEKQKAKIDEVKDPYDALTIINNEHVKDVTTERNNLQTKTNDTKKNKGQITCDTCGKFTDPYKLEYHMNVHYGIRPFRCKFEKCTSTFTSPFDLSKHYKRCHIIDSSYTCEICGKSFKFLTTFKYHKTYHGEPKIPCEICGKLLRNDRVVKKHMMVHTGERPFPCDLCTKSFQNRYNLRVHKRIHTKERPYACCFCDESFGYNCLLKAHTEKIHNILRN